MLFYTMVFSSVYNKFYKKKNDIDLDYPPSKSFQIIIIEKITITKIKSQVSIDSHEQFKYLKFLVSY
jgi:hypothetical protein